VSLRARAGPSDEPLHTALKARPRPADPTVVGPFRLSLAVLAVACGLAASAAAEVYRWTDPEGKVHYTSDLSRVPASQQDAAKASAGEPKGGAVMRIESRPPAKPTGPAAAPEEAPTGPDGTPAGPDGTPAAPPQPAEEVYGGRNESWWRSEAAKFREAIERLEAQTEQCTAGEFRWSAGAGGRAYREESAEADACGRIQSELQMNRRWQETLKENAHRAGVPPGWLRD